MEHPAALAALLAGFEVGGDAGRQKQLNRLLCSCVQGTHERAETPERVESMRLLLAAGAEMNLREGLFSLLGWAALEGHVGAFRLLLEAGANVGGEASLQERIRASWKQEAVPALLAALEGAAAGGGRG